MLEDAVVFLDLLFYFQDCLKVNLNNFCFVARKWLIFHHLMFLILLHTDGRLLRQYISMLLNLLITFHYVHFVFYFFLVFIILSSQLLSVLVNKDITIMLFVGHVADVNELWERQLIMLQKPTTLGELH